MACFPKIDRPCPLAVDEQRRIAGYCGQCRKHVHSLDALDAPARLALLKHATAPICVSYRVPARIGAALILTMAGATFAADKSAGVQSDMTRPSPEQANAGIDISQYESTTYLNEAQSDSISAYQLNQMPSLEERGNVAEQLEVIMLGGVSDPQTVEWIDTDAQSELPELPIIEE